MISCIAYLLPRTAEDVATRPINQESVKDRLDSGQLRRDLLPQRAVVAQLLGLNALNNPLGLANQLVELLGRPDIEVPETAEVFAQILDDRVAKDLGLAITGTAQSLGEVRDELGQLLGKGLLSQLDRFVKACGNALGFLLVEVRAELTQ